MVTVTNLIGIHKGKDCVEMACLSTDTKPTTGVANGSKCIEMDTGKKYMFNEEDSEWEELPSSGGGGGGSSDFSTAEVTLLCTVGESVTVDVVNFAFLEGDWINSDLQLYAGDDYTLPAVLYKSTAIPMFSAEGGENINIGVTGNATIDPDFGNVIITGDCTITIS